MAKKMTNYIQGIYKPKHREKYKGDVDNIIYRSSYELQFMQKCDMSPAILEWSSEEVAIPYVKPTDGKIHRYFLDFWIKYATDDYEKEDDYWELIDETQYNTEKQKKIREIKEGQVKSNNLLIGNSPPDPKLGKINNLYLNETNKTLYLKKKGEYLLNNKGERIRIVKRAIIEIKPYSQTIPPKKQQRITESYRKKWSTYAINKAKWESAMKYAEKNNMEFIIITEKYLKNSK